MIKKQVRMAAQSEISLKQTKETFFIENDPNGIVSATVFNDHYVPLKGNRKKFARQKQLWQYLKEGRPIDGLLEETPDQKNGDTYVWVVFTLPKGTFPARFDTLSPGMLEFIVKYQALGASINCNLEELMEEAHRIENGRRNSLQSTNKLPFQSKDFDDKSTNDDADKAAQ